MTPRAAGRLAWSLAVLALALLAATFVLSAGSSTGSGPDVLIAAIALVFSAVGALVASRHPRNPIGWIFVGVALTTGPGTLAGWYADRWIDGGGGSEALVETAAWYSNLSWMPWILVPATFVLLLFPDGRLLSRRWRPIAWCAGLGIAGAFLAEGLRPGPISDYPQIQNPYGVEGGFIDPLSGLAYLVLLVGLAGSAVSIVLRFRRAGGEQRQQIKWLALAGAVAVTVVPVAVAGYGLWGEDAGNVATMFSVLCLPVAAGVAISRYRLYDIDVVINRTLVYGALTATLAAAYLASVLLLQLLLRPLTEDSGLAIAGSTLAVAALFRPARARIQAAVDRRFYRRRYDAQRTLEAFAGRLRDEVALDALSAELRGVVGNTMQPAHVSLWLRGPQAPQ